MLVSVLNYLPEIEILNLHLGTNVNPEHLEEMFTTPRLGLKHLELHFRIWLSHASYYQFLKGLSACIILTELIVSQVHTLTPRSNHSIDTGLRYLPSPTSASSKISRLARPSHLLLSKATPPVWPTPSSISPSTPPPLIAIVHLVVPHHLPPYHPRARSSREGTQATDRSRTSLKR